MKKLAAIFILMLLLLPAVCINASASVAVGEWNYDCYYMGWSDTTKDYTIQVDHQYHNNTYVYSTSVDGFNYFMQDEPGWTYENGTYSTMTHIYGSLVVYDVSCYYYYKPQHTVTYQITGDYFANDSYETQLQTDKSTVDLLSDPVAPGYDFNGWTSTDVDLSGGTYVMPENDITISGTFTPRTDTPFTVEFYQQNITDNNYTQISTDTYSGQGTTDTPIQGAVDMTALSAQYPGFHLTTGSLNDTTGIAGDGTGILKLYYDRNSANVTYRYSGKLPLTAVNLPPTTTVRYGATVNVAELPTLTGYDFDGWTSENADITSGSFSMPDGDVSVSGTWVPLIEPYKVEYYLEELDGSYTLTDQENCSGDTDARALVPIKSYTGFTETSASRNLELSTTIAGDGSTLLKLYFNRVIYTVSCSYSGETDVTPPALPAAASYRYGETVNFSATDPSLPGYDFGGWTSPDADVTSGTFIMPAANVVITGAWIPRSDTAYTVEYYQQSISDDDYTLVDRVDGQGTTGAVIPGIHRDYTGFTLTGASAAAESTKIASDGSTAVKLYFDRNVYSVTYAYAGDTDSTPPALPATVTYRYGDTVALSDPAPGLQGYTFSGWITTNTTVTDGLFHIPDSNVVFTGTWYPKDGTAFVVHYYLQELDDLYTLTDTVNGTGITGQTIPGIHRDYAGFTLADASAAAESTKIASVGSTVVDLYFGRNSYTVSFAYAGDDSIPKDAPALPDDQVCKFGQSVTVPADPTTSEGKVFYGWKVAGITITDGSFIMPATNVSVIGTWGAAPALPFTVSFDSNGGSSVDAQTLYSGDFISEPVAPTLAGYTFAGWYADSAFSTAWDFARRTVTEDTTLYAKWTIMQYTVNFDSTGGSSVDPQTVAYNSLAVEPAAPTLIGYTFAGWYADGAFSTAWDFANDTVAGDTILYAKWAVIWYTVSFDSNGGSSVPGQTVVYDGLVAKPIAPIKTGYTFARWYTDSALNTAWDFANDTVTGDTTLYAKWNAVVVQATELANTDNFIPTGTDQHTSSISNLMVLFDSNGGSTIQAQAVYYGQRLIAPETPVKEGYIFAGWYTDNNLQQPWDFKDAAVSGDVTLYAKWIPEPATPLSAEPQNPPAEVPESASENSHRTDTLLLCVGLTGIGLLIVLLAAKSRRANIYDATGKSLLCRVKIRHGMIDLTDACHKFIGKAFLVKIGSFYSLGHLGRKLCIFYQGKAILEDRLDLRNQYEIDMS